VTTDDTIRPGVTLEKLRSLKPAFPQWAPSTTTAGNASGIGDGAGLCILTTRENAEKEGMPIIGKWVGSTVVGVEPRYMGISPAFAIPKLLKQYGLCKKDVDIYEVG
jgi:acetyl-CoA acetyltransferase